MQSNNIKLSVSMLALTTEQILALYEEKQIERCSPEVFVQEFKDRQKIAVEDAEKLHKMVVSSSRIIEKINELVSKSNRLYRSNFVTKSMDVLSLDFTSPVIDIIGLGRGDLFRVSGFNQCELRVNQCILCDHEIFGPVTYQIENAKTLEHIKCKQMTLHLIESHDYFSKGTYRLDPVRVCEVLNLYKRENRSSIAPKE